MMYEDDCPACARTYAGFRILHEDLDPDAVTQALQILPTKANRRGDVRNPRGRRPVTYNFGSWHMSSEGSTQSRDIRRHVDWLLDRLEPSREALRQLQAAGCRTDIFCYWDCAGESGGPRLSPAQMARLAELGIEIGFDIYFTSSDE